MINFFTKKARGLRNRFLSKGIILMYHSIAEVDNDPWQLCVSRKNFEEQLEVFRKSCNVLFIEALEKKIKHAKFPIKLGAVTFDDGYNDNLNHALPILEKLEVPATIFIATAFNGYNQEFWWDELEGSSYSQIHYLKICH